MLLNPRLFPRFCHQLDFSTSGALCVALNKAAAGSAYKCFKERLVTKAYLALVSPPCHGLPRPSAVRESWGRWGCSAGEEKDPGRS